MDKSFNEDELSDIMKEIEALEENLHIEDAKPAVAPKPQPKMESMQSPVEDEDEFIPQQTVSKITEEEIPAKAEVVDFRPKSAQEKNWSQSPASMSFKVSGDMHLELSFEIDGKHVQLGIDETGLVIGLDGGATFKVPLKKSA